MIRLVWDFTIALHWVDAYRLWFLNGTNRVLTTLRYVTSVSAFLEDVKDQSSIKYTGRAKADMLKRYFLCFHHRARWWVTRCATVYWNHSRIQIIWRKCQGTTDEHQRKQDDKARWAASQDIERDCKVLLFSAVLWRQAFFQKHWKLVRISPTYKKSRRSTQKTTDQLVW